ncbi:MAG TPA: hypothetical protein VJU61_18125 [Polyangiaceae bacterium]|nr:hypothetical protein [Polyangiaceae bacterium]
MTERIASLLRRVSSVDEPANAQEAELRERLGGRGNLAAVEREIASEIAHSLGNAARKLEAAIARVSALLGELGALPVGAEARRALRTRYDEERLLAERRLRDLIIQREAIGFRRHPDVYQRYVIPRWPSE